MQFIKNPLRSTWSEILKRPVKSMAELEKIVAPVLQKVKNEGDKALKEFSLQFDKADLKQFEVSISEIEKAKNVISDDLKSAIAIAYQNIKLFHSAQKSEIIKIETTKGVTCWRKSVGIQKVGIYIPGGTAPLFSTILMLAIPAQLAGCEEIILCSPPNANGEIHPAILYTANLCGVKKIFKIGGSQAIAAMAYGTETVPKVFKIFGPGNQYVTVAKQLVNKEGVAIDMPAGPSEVAIMADETANPVFVASDLLSQAEHGADSQVLLVSTNENILKDVQTEVAKQLKELPREAFASAALENSKAILLNSESEMIDLINQYAAEHLIISTKNAEEIGDKIINAGSVFLGHFTPEAAGDYASGTNHTLPTNGYATAYSGVSLDSFYKKITYQNITKEGILNLGPTIEKMAEAEMLFAHKNAISVRLKELMM
ncbi:MAG: histidinol dehydrogenase [Bacteroidetes bacterium]|nr:MAG: histidinol dehydrogenase [Bacteroidota bacterium]